MKMDEFTFKFMVCSEPEATQKEIRRIMEENEAAGHYVYVLATLWGVYGVSHGQFEATKRVCRACEELASGELLVINDPIL